MKFLTVVSWLAASACLVVVRADDVFVDGVRHQTEVLIDNITMAYHSLAVDNEYNNLYFLENYHPVILNLNTMERKYIEGINSATSLTVDQEAHELYIGTFQGIFKYKPITGNVEYVGAERHLIRNIFFKKILYFIDFYTKRVYKLDNGHHYKVVDMQYEVLGFVIDKEDVMFFENSTGLYSQQVDSNRVTLLNESRVTSLVVDKYSKVYFNLDGWLCDIIKYNATVRKLVYIKYPVGKIAFDKNNNIIYSDFNTIYRLKPITEGNDNITSSDSHENKINVTNNTNSADIEKQMERKLDIVDKKMDKLVEMHESMNRKIYDLSQKIDTLLTDPVGSKMGGVFWIKPLAKWVNSSTIV